MEGFFVRFGADMFGSCCQSACILGANGKDYRTRVQQQCNKVKNDFPVSNKISQEKTPHTRKALNVPTKD